MAERGQRPVTPSQNCDGHGCGARDAAKPTGRDRLLLRVMRCRRLISLRSETPVRTRLRHRSVRVRHRRTPRWMFAPAAPGRPPPSPDDGHARAGCATLRPRPRQRSVLQRQALHFIRPHPGRRSARLRRGERRIPHRTGRKDGRNGHRQVRVLRWHRLQYASRPRSSSKASITRFRYAGRCSNLLYQVCTFGIAGRSMSSSK